MKFAKYLEDNLVPEWRIKYLDYKVGKKKLKAVGRAIRNAEAASDTNISSSPITFTNIANKVRRASFSRPDTLQTSSSPAVAQAQDTPPSNPNTTPVLSTPKAGPTTPRTPKAPKTPGTPGTTRKSKTDLLQIGEEEHEDQDNATIKPSNVSPRTLSNERQPIRSPSPRAYGTMSDTPASNSTYHRAPPSLSLPAPAQEIDSRNSLQLTRTVTFDDSDLASYGDRGSLRGPPFNHSEVNSASAHEAQNELAPHEPTTPSSRKPEPLLRRVYSNLVHKRNNSSMPTDINRNTITYLEMTENSQREFFNFLDSELRKIEEFYNEKELEAKERFMILEHQIGLMSEYRSHEKEEAAREKARSQMKFGWRNPAGIVNDVWHGKGLVSEYLQGDKKDEDNGTANMDIGASHMPTVARLSALAAETIAAPARTHSIDEGPSRDYDRRKRKDHLVPYRTAKRKLKVAITEYYRGLELLKSYCLLNREGFRKILKKFDKTAHRKIASKYIKEKIDTAAFSDSDALDQLINKTELMFAEHYEKGRRKHAVERLRTREHRRSNYGAMFRNGIYLGAGLPLFVQSVVLALSNPRHDHTGMHHEQEISYLLQIWAGFGFPALLMMLFTLCCRAWALARINYVFVFEFDTRHNLDWHQLLEIPSLIMFIQSILMYFCFTDFWGDTMDRIWFPVIHLIVVLILLLNPLPVFYLPSRKWFLYSLYRLFWAGLFPVEFRDFFLGDIFCSLTYSMGNISLFFCLYSRDWNNPPACNSSHSRLLGFFSALPSVWRLLQCFRRYYDTKQWFPHLANGGKYTFGVLFYMSLSMYRINHLNSYKAFFIFCATINALYTSTWDLLMDWSLLDWYAPHKLLRNELAFKRAWLYYLAMVVDPIIRFNWIFYAIFAQELQHSASLSFFVSLSEVFRRWMWSFFRMENEHCTNVRRFRAYRDDIPLPYHVPCPGLEARNSTGSSRPSTSQLPHSPSTTVRPATGVVQVDTETQNTRFTPRLRAFSIATNAHAADFERRKPETGGKDHRAPPNRLRKAFTSRDGAGGRDSDDDDEADDVSSSEEEEEDDDPDMHDEEIAMVDDRVHDMAGLRRRRDSRASTEPVRRTGTGLVMMGGESSRAAGATGHRSHDSWDYARRAQS